MRGWPLVRRSARITRMEARTNSQRSARNPKRMSCNASVEFMRRSPRPSDRLVMEDEPRMAGPLPQPPGPAPRLRAYRTAGPGQPAALALHRAEIDQATGMLTEQLGVGIEEAFVRLRAYAYADDRRLTEVARDIVARRLRLGPGPGAPGDHVA